MHIFSVYVVSSSAALCILGSIFCILIGGTVAGLTLGLMSLDKVGLEVLLSEGGIQAQYARQIMPLRERGNLLLVTLLLANTAVNELLPLLVDAIPGESATVSFLMSTILVMLFGEIIPQSICARHGLYIGAKLVWFVKILRVLFFPVAWPISIVLDKLLGQELGTVYNRSELKGLIELHSVKKYGHLSDDETTILKGALDFSQKTVSSVMTPMCDVFMLDVTAVLDRPLLTTILHRGYSRIPVYERSCDNVLCILLVKNLLLLNPDRPTSVRDVLSDVTSREATYVLPDAHLDVALNDFQTGRGHMAVVRRDGINLGIVTLEDVLEELIQEEIVDETDQFVDVHKRTPVPRSASVASYPPRSAAATVVRRTGALAQLTMPGTPRRAPFQPDHDLASSPSSLVSVLSPTAVPKVLSPSSVGAFSVGDSGESLAFRISDAKTDSNTKWRNAAATGNTVLKVAGGAGALLLPSPPSHMRSFSFDTATSPVSSSNPATAGGILDKFAPILRRLQSKQI